MTLLELKRLLQDMIANDPDKCDATVRILTETADGQVEQNLGGVAHSPRLKHLILLPEGFDE